MQAVLAIFQGRATLASAVEQENDEFEDEVVATTAPLPTMVTTIAEPVTDEPVTPNAPPTTTGTQAFEAIPEVEAEENVFGVVPDGAVRCP